MQVAQRGTSSSSSGYHTVDRFALFYTGTDESLPLHNRKLMFQVWNYTIYFRIYVKHLKVTNGNQTSGAGAGDEYCYKI